MATAAQPARDEPEEIIVWSPPQFRDIRPERDLDERGIASYGLSSIEELVAEVQAELDGEEDEPVYVVNGERINDLDEIGGYPVEALRQVQVLPRGSATRMGGRAGQRIVSLTLHRQMRSAIVLAAPKLATEGDFRASRGEINLTHIRGRSRGNLLFRARDEGSLLESERGIVQPQPTRPFATTGNLVSAFLAQDEIDPLLSNAAGQLVTVAAVPAGSGATLGDFVAGANRPAATDIGHYRTLRPDTRHYDLIGTYGTRVAPWLTSTATVKLSRSNNHSLRGLPPAFFTLGQDNPYSPFSQEVGLAYYGLRPLSYRSRRESGDASARLNARIGKWQANWSAQHVRTIDRSRSDRQQMSQLEVPADVNPFSGALLDLLPFEIDVARTRARTSSTQLTLMGSPLKLPAGEVQTTLEGRLSRSHLTGRSSFSTNGERSIARTERSVRGGLEVPLTSRRGGASSAPGELRATADYSLGSVSGSGSVSSHAVGLTWEPVQAVRLRGSLEGSKVPPQLELIGNPLIILPDARIFDVLSGRTVDVTQISGGNPALRPERTRTRRLSGVVTIDRSLGVQANAEYVQINEKYFVSSLPPLSATVVAAFPERFQRDADGNLIRVDLRPVNFASHRQKRLRYGLNFTVPLGGSGPPPRLSQDSDSEDNSPPAGPARQRRPATRLQLTANHAVVFDDEILIRPGLDSVDLLGGGAIGIAGGRVRHQFDGTAALLAGGLGARLGVNWRGGNLLQTRVGTDVTELRFSALLQLNLRLFADAKQLLGSVGWVSGTRLSLNVTNLTGKRQRVRDPNGNVPLQFQPAYRDPLGRTVEFELRKSF